MTSLWDLNRKPRLLFVEDEIDYANMFKLYFKGLGADVTVAVQASEGLAICSIHLFDLVY